MVQKSGDSTELAPAGSLEPINKDKGHWHDHIDGAALSQLQGLAKDINKTVDSTIRAVARGKIKVGKLLLEARAFFPDDQSFGKWRKEHTQVQSKQHAHYLMKVADRFSDAPHLIEGTNYSVLQELITAPDEAIKWVEAQVAKGDTPTVTQARAVAKGEDPPEKVERKGTSKKALLGSGAKPAPKPSIIPPGHERNKLVQRNLSIRIRDVGEGNYDVTEGAYIILGLDPEPQCAHNRMSVFALKDYWSEEACNEEELQAVWQAAEAVINDIIGWE